MPKDIRYKGNWKGLEALGYEYHQKMDCYSKGSVDNRVWIWKKGRDVEILDNYSCSYLVLEYLIQTGFEIPIIETGNKVVPIKDWLKLVLDREAKTIELHDLEKHDMAFIVVEGKQATVLPKPKGWKEIILNKEIVDILKELYNNSMLEITERESRHGEE